MILTASIDDIRALLYRARQYREIHDDRKASDILSDAASRCGRLLKDFDPDSSIAFDGDSSVGISTFLQGNHPVSYLNDSIWEYLCHDEHQDRDLISLITIVGEVDLDRERWSAAQDAFSYAVLTSIRCYGIHHKSTAEPLRGLGRACLERKDFRYAERALRAALDAYMRLDHLEEQDKRKVDAIVLDLNRARQQQETPVTRWSDVCREIVYLALILVLVPWMLLNSDIYLGIQAKLHNHP
ncbi:hypothetical protein EIK77_003324 [Talaromyces pinophilus]|nr:hypothetical protein EIK77_003324 [Talaromyces pinophilus]